MPKPIQTEKYISNKHKYITYYKIPEPEISQIILKIHDHMHILLPSEWHPAHATKLGRIVLH